MVQVITDLITDLGYELDDDELADLAAQEAAEEALLGRGRGANRGTLDPEMADFVDQLIKRTIMFCEELWGNEFRPYQRSMSYRIIESSDPRGRRGDHRADGPPVR